MLGERVIVTHPARSQTEARVSSCFPGGASCDLKFSFLTEGPHPGSLGNGNSLYDLKTDAKSQKPAEADCKDAVESY